MHCGIPNFYAMIFKEGPLHIHICKATILAGPVKQIGKGRVRQGVFAQGLHSPEYHVICLFVKHFETTREFWLFDSV